MKISKAFGRSVLYAGSTFYMKGISLFMVPLVVRYLQAEEFGRLEYIGSFAIFLSVIVGFGLEDTLYRYAGKQKTASASAYTAANIYGLVLLISVLFLGVSAALLFIYDSTMNTYASTYLCFILVLTLSMEGIISVPLGWIRMKDHFKLYCSINVARATFQAAITVTFLSMGRGVEGVFEAGCISTALTALICFIYQKRSSGFQLSKKMSFIFIRYASPLVASGFLAFGLSGFDRWVLADSTSLTELAFYAVTGKFAIALTIAMQPYGMWWSPTRFSLLNEHDGHQKASRYATYGLLQVALFSLVIGLLAPVILISLFPSEFHSCIVLIAPLLAVFAVKESAEFLSIGCFAKDSTATQMKISLFTTLIGIALMLYATPKLGLSGLILSLLIAQICRTVLLFIAAQKEVRLAIPYYRVLILFVTTFVSITLTNINLAQDLEYDSPINLTVNDAVIWMICIICFGLACKSLFNQLLSATPVSRYIESSIVRNCQRLNKLIL